MVRPVDAKVVVLTAASTRPGLAVREDALASSDELGERVFDGAA
jgi:hypothetical protein